MTLAPVARFEGLNAIVRECLPRGALAAAVLLAAGSVAGAQLPAPFRLDASRLAAAPSGPCGKGWGGPLRRFPLPEHLPPEPAVVTRLRARPRKTREEFLTWGESLMQEPTAVQRQNAARSLQLIESFVRRPEIPAGCFLPKRVGWLRAHGPPLGRGSRIPLPVQARIHGRFQ